MSGRLSAPEITTIATAALAKLRISDITPKLMTGIAFVESGDAEMIQAGCNPAAYAEDHNGGSYGLWQMDLSTAKWLATALGYNALGTPIAANLYDPATCGYFAGAYLHWLRGYKGIVRPDSFVVSAYNGGPGGYDGPGPRAYYQRYLVALSHL